MGVFDIDCSFRRFIHLSIAGRLTSIVAEPAMSPQQNYCRRLVAELNEEMTLTLFIINAATARGRMASPALGVRPLVVADAAPADNLSAPPLIYH